MTIEIVKSELEVFLARIKAKDSYTQGHSHHVRSVVEVVASCQPESVRGRVSIDKLRLGALLHDLGKTLIPDRILNREGSLSEEDWKVVRLHPEIGAKILKGTVFEDLADMVRYHHERFDGKGYYGLSGTDIPLEARLISIADTFSALRSYRIYRSAKSIDATLDIMREASGTQLDAALLEPFLRLDVEKLQALEYKCDLCRKREALLQNPKGLAISA